MSSRPPRSPLLPDDPRRLGRYELRGRLGRGAQGVVFLARTRDARLVALKLLHADRVERPGARERLADEAATARRVRGKFTARVLDVDVGGPRPYIVSEYVAGPSLHRRVRRRGPLGAAALDRLMVGSATALVAIHSAGIVHRDLKPANILLGPEGPRVIDFGVAHVEDATATLTGAPVGTPAYMAPEQVAGVPAGCPADVFAWASTMVYAATGQAPFGRDDPRAVMNRIASHDPDLSGLQAPLRPLLRSCLHKDPKTRPTAQTVLRHLLELGLAGPRPRHRPRLTPRAPWSPADTAGRRPRDRTGPPSPATASHDAPSTGERPRPTDERDTTRAGRRGRARSADGPGTPRGRARRRARPGEDQGTPRGGARGRAHPAHDQHAPHAGTRGRARPADGPGTPRAGARGRTRPAGDGGGRARERGTVEEHAARELPPRPSREQEPRSGRGAAARPGRRPAAGIRRTAGRRAGGRPDGGRAARDAGRWPGDRDTEDAEDRGSATRRRGYAAAVVVTILIGLTLGVLYPWANADDPPSPGGTATPTATATP